MKLFLINVNVQMFSADHTKNLSHIIAPLIILSLIKSL